VNESFAMTEPRRTASSDYTANRPRANKCLIAAFR
jgi:hypothetical protein